MNRLDLTLRSTIHIQYANALDSSQLVVVVNALATNRLTDEELRRGGNEGGRLGIFTKTHVILTSKGVQRKTVVFANMELCAIVWALAVY